eukprot:Unigene13201_Nuclearia_a/m.39993 Unigene13201_Nuclearia_a/g.39993  ORF Unigene13201_Nuclearia_a/g.39993 Unigene13201_Nuclearia_a/m.39993 type:complete len:328 (+) Unigene13201_Nuclearia_a:87-1070(+)
MAVPMTARGLLRVAGRDAATFVNGLASNRTLWDAHAPGAPQQQGVFTAFLTPQGRVLCDAFVLPENGALLVDCHRDVAPRLLEHLRKYKIRVKVEINDATAEYRVAQRLPGAAAPLNGAVITTRDPRLPALGERLVLRAGEPVPAGENGLDAYTLLRYQNGVAEGPAEIAVGEAFPFECNLDLTHGVSMQKGCYLGQELTSRTFYRGVTRKRMMPLKLLPLTTRLEPAVVNVHNVDRAFQPKLPLARARLYRTDTNKAVGFIAGSVHDVALGMVRWEALNGWSDHAVPAIAVARPHDGPEPAAVEYLYWAVPHVPEWWPSMARPQEP